MNFKIYIIYNLYKQNMNNQITEYFKNYLFKHGQLEAQMVDQPTYRDKLSPWIIKYLSRCKNIK